MQSFFSPLKANRNTRVFPGLFQAQKGLNANLLKMSEYVRTSTKRLRSNHLLVKLLESIPPAPATTALRHYDLVEDVAEEIARGLRISTDIQSGELTSGNFYGGDVKEIVIAGTLNRPEFNAQDELLNWDSISAVRILYHPSSDLNFNVPYGVEQTDAFGYAVIMIDIPLLTIQYTHWANLQNSKPIDRRQTTQQFIYRYVLGNMIDRQLEIAMFNRYRDINNDITPSKVIERTPLALAKHTGSFDKEVPDVMEYLYDSAASTEDVLDNIPLTIDNTLRDILPFTSLTETRQIYWAILAMWLPYVLFLSHFYLINQQGEDRRWAKQLKRQLRRIKTDKLTKNAPDAMLQLHLDTMLEELSLIIE